MKKILFVSDMNCDHCVSKISAKLDETRLSYTVDLSKKAVILDADDADSVYLAKSKIQEAGYTVD